MTRNKCKPQTLPNNNEQLPNCGFPIFMDPQKLYRDNVNDIAKSLGVIIILCGIHECKANNAVDIIKSIFGHYEEARHRPYCEKSPAKMCKYNVLVCLAKKCLMTLVEAQLTYYIIKYAVKAYFNSKPEIGIRSAIMDTQLICGEETAWIRAAKRTAQVYDECRDILRPIVKNYYAEIKSVYSCLFQRIKQRTVTLEIPGQKMFCKSCEKLASSSTSQFNLKELPETEKEYPFDSFPKCCKCNFPLDLCSCRINPKTGKLCVDCSQGPFVCEWYRMDKEYRVKAKQHVCPIDCEKDSSLLSEDECQCDLPQLEDCEIEDNETDDSEFGKDFIDETQSNCVEESESGSEECEPKMEGCTYCCHMPVCDRTIYMETQKRQPHIKRDSDEPIFVEFQMIPPSKNIKRVRLPPETQQRKKRIQTKIEKKWVNNKFKAGNDMTTGGTEEKNKNLDENIRTGKSQDAFNRNEKTTAGNETTNDNDNAINQRDAKKGDDGTKFGRNKGDGKGDTGNKNASSAGVENLYTNPKKNGKSRLLGSFRASYDENRNNGKQRSNGQQRKNGEISKKSGKPCCKCGKKKEKIEPVKCGRCKPVLIRKNRIIPAPVEC